MKAMLVMTFFFCSLCWSDTSLFLFGGGARPEEALRDFIRTSGGEKSNLLIIHWASVDNEGAINIQRDLRRLTNAKIEIISNDTKEIEKQVSKASGIFFAGGDQNKLMIEMNKLGLKPIFKQKYLSGVSFAGTSAGTAIMSEKMITGEGDFTVLNGKAVELAEGLGLLPREVIVDQHFIYRGRFNRLAGVVLDANMLGIGIDEDNALAIYDHKSAKAFGPTQVLMFSPKTSKSLNIDVFDKKDFIDLNQYPQF